jgi:hypothetical protein
MHRWLKRLITPPLLLLAALLMFVEEVLWEGAKRLTAAIASVPLLGRVVRAIESLIAGLPPYGAMAVFLLPGTLLLPVKLGALWLIAHGHALLGLQLIIAAKLLGTALVARIFVLTKSKLLTLPWFAKLYGWLTRTRDALYAWVRASQLWQRLSELRAALKFKLKRLKPSRLRMRFKAAQRLKKRAAFR